MKYLNIILASSILFASCGNKKEASIESIISTGNIEEIRIKKKDIEAKGKLINDQLDSLNIAISRLDTIKKLPLITTFTGKKSVFNHYLELQGNVSTKQNVLIYPETPGILDQVLVKEGQSVKKGEILAVINDGGLLQQLAQLETQTLLAKTTYERQKRLWDQKIGSEIEFLQAKTSYLAQTNTVEQLKSQLTRTKITAPFSGTIDEIFIEQGSVVGPGIGSEVFRIINLNKMYIEAEVPESYISNVTKGKTVEVYFPILGKTVKTSVRQVGNFINPDNRSFKIEVDVPNNKRDIKPNLTAKLKINDYQNGSAVLIPQSIISENAKGQQYIYVITNKKANNEAIAKKTIIKTGKTQGDVIEVINSLEDGVEIIEEGARSVNDGQVVKILKK